MSYILLPFAILFVVGIPREWPISWTNEVCDRAFHVLLASGLTSFCLWVAR